MTRVSNALLWPVLLAAAAPSRAAEPPSRHAAAYAPCVRLDKAGTVVSGEVKICPGRYRVPDRMERGVLVVSGSGTRIDLTGVTLESGDTVPAAFTGIGILSRGADSITVRGGRIRGFRYGIRIEGARALGERHQPLRLPRPGAALHPRTVRRGRLAGHLPARHLRELRAGSTSSAPGVPRSPG